MFLEKAKAMESTLLRQFTHLHQCPEPGYYIPQTSSYIKSQLEELGIAYQCIDEHGIIADLGKKDGPCILLRADMDALEIVEESHLPYASTNGFCHACGHDTHMTMLLGAAAILKEQEASLQGSVRLMFQPDEEGYNGGGAQKMLGAHILEKVDAAMAIHCDPSTDRGLMKTCAGPFFASLDSIKITVTGKGGHGATPEKCVDPIYVAHMIYQALQEIFVREISGKDVAVFTICKFHAGTAINVIPVQAVMEGTLRTFDEHVRAHITSRMKIVVENVAQMYGAKADITFVYGLPATCNDAQFTAQVGTILKQTFSEPQVNLQAESLMGSEDFGFVAQLVPSVLLLVGFADPEDNDRYFWHHPKVKYDPSAIAYGAAAYAAVAFHWLAMQSVGEGK